MDEKNVFTAPPPEYLAQQPGPGQPAQYAGQPAQYPGQPAQYVGQPNLYGQPNPQPGKYNPAFVQSPGPNVNFHQPGQQIVNGQAFPYGQPCPIVNIPPKCDEKRMPNLMGVIGACIFCLPLGIGALIWYLRAHKSKGNCFDNSHFIYHFVILSCSKILFMKQ